MTPERPPPFEIKDCALITLALGVSALNLRELRDGVASVPAQSLYHHFHETLLRPAFDDPEYRNEFASWSGHQLHDAILAERLGMIDPMEFEDLEALRACVLDVIEDRLAEAPFVPTATAGREFQFRRSQLVVFDTGRRAETPSRLAVMVPEISTGSIFFHFVDARRRPPLLRDDFSAWLRLWGPRYEDLTSRVAAVDFSLWTLTEMRDRIAAAFEATPPDEEVA